MSSIDSVVTGRSGSAPAGPRVLGHHAQSQRDVALNGPASRRWFARRGYTVSAVEPFPVFADVLGSGRFEVARLWHAAAELRHGPDGSLAGWETLIVQVEGELRIDGGTLEAGDLALLPASLDFALVASAPSARIEIRLPRPPGEESLRRVVLRSARESPYRGILVGTVNAALNASLSPLDPGFPGFQLAVEHLVAALIVEAGGAPAPKASRSLEIHAEAVRLIDSEARDPAFTVASLAERLHVTQRQLQRAFAERETTPKAQIQERRIALAQAYLRLPTARGSRPSRMEIARRSGFRTERSMDRALRETR